MFDASNFAVLTIGASVVSLADASPVPNFATPTPVRKALISLEPEEAWVRFKTEGGDPTLTEGHLVKGYDLIEITGLNDISNARFIRGNAVNAIASISFSRGN